ICSTCCLEAISGTTPPNRLWLSICEETTLARTSLPFLTSAAAVSSQLVSIAKIICSFFIINSPTSLKHLLRYQDNNFFANRPAQDRTFGTVFVQLYLTLALLMINALRHFASRKT